MDEWECVEIGYHHPLMVITPQDVIDVDWLVRILPKAKIRTDHMSYRLSNLPTKSDEDFWLVLKTLMKEGWQPFHWDGSAAQ
jgi:hypothetical protein